MVYENTLLGLSVIQVKERMATRWKIYYHWDNLITSKVQFPYVIRIYPIFLQNMQLSVPITADYQPNGASIGVIRLSSLRYIQSAPAKTYSAIA